MCSLGSVRNSISRSDVFKTRQWRRIGANRPPWARRATTTSRARATPLLLRCKARQSRHGALQRSRRASPSRLEQLHQSSRRWGEKRMVISFSELLVFLFFGLRFLTSKVPSSTSRFAGVSPLSECRGLLRCLFRR